MGFFRNKPKVNCPLSSREEQLLSRISELEEFIEGAPDRIRREMEEEITTMPRLMTWRTAAVNTNSTPSSVEEKSAMSIVTRPRAPFSFSCSSRPS